MKTSGTLCSVIAYVAFGQKSLETPGKEQCGPTTFDLQAILQKCDNSRGHFS